MKEQIVRFAFYLLKVTKYVQEIPDVDGQGFVTLDFGKRRATMFCYDDHVVPTK